MSEMYNECREYAKHVAEEIEAYYNGTTNEDGEEVTTRITGVYCVVGRFARFKPVTVLYTGDGFSLVESAAGKESLRLRPGEEIILTARELSDGAVVR